MVLLPSFADDPAHELRELVRASRFQEALDLHGRVTGGTDDVAAVGVGAPGGALGRRPDVQLLAATAATRLGELARGGALALEALERFRQRADADGRMRALNLLGAINWERGRLDEADRCFTEALALAHELNDSLIAAHASNNLASVAHLRGQPELALGLYRGALLAYQRLGDRRGTAQTWHNLGLTFRQMRDRREAERAAREAVRHAELVGEPGLMALVLTGRAEVELARGEYAMAAQALDRAQRLAADAGDEIGGAEVGRLRARLALERGEPAEARGLAEAALVVAHRYGSALLEAECAAVAALAAKALGHADEALRRREDTLAQFRRLEAADLEERFEEEWHDTADGIDPEMT